MYASMYICIYSVYASGWVYTLAEPLYASEPVSPPRRHRLFLLLSTPLLGMLEAECFAARTEREEAGGKEGMKGEELRERGRKEGMTGEIERGRFGERTLMERGWRDERMRRIVRERLEKDGV